MSDHQDSAPKDQNLQDPETIPGYQPQRLDHDECPMQMHDDFMDEEFQFEELESVEESKYPAEQCYQKDINSKSEKFGKITGNLFSTDLEHEALF